MLEPGTLWESRVHVYANPDGEISELIDAGTFITIARVDVPSNRVHFFHKAIVWTISIPQFLAGFYYSGNEYH